MAHRPFKKKGTLMLDRTQELCAKLKTTHRKGFAERTASVRENSFVVDLHLSFFRDGKNEIGDLLGLFLGEVDLFA